MKILSIVFSIVKFAVPFTIDLKLLPVYQEMVFLSQFLFITNLFGKDPYMLHQANVV